MSQGPRSSPPRVNGYVHQRWLGGGGFADVFLYRSETVQELEVAVKVLIHATPDPGEFRSEANQMARVSSHPFIVDVHSAGVAPDGRPYLVMKYFGDDNLERRVRAEGRLGVDEVLRLGVQIASAVQTAHIAGILHRDIKPANILVDPYGHPGLADFGVAGAILGDDAQAALSPQYSAPEVHDGSSAGSEQSDVYALAASLYRLLAGRAPFEYAGQDNSYKAVVPRVLSHPPPPIGVPDVPASLEHLLRQALSKDPSQRPPTAEALAHALQTIERERGLTPTAFAMVAAGRSRPSTVMADDDDDRTSLGRVQVVDPSRQPEAPARPPIRYVEAPGLSSLDPAVPSAASVETDETLLRSGVPAEAAAVPIAIPAKERSTSWKPAIAAVGILVLVGGIIAVATRTESPPEPDPTPTSAPRPSLIIDDVPPVPTKVRVEVQGSSVLVSWDTSGSGQGDSWLVTRTNPSSEPVVVATSPARLADVVPGQCVAVVARRGASQSAPSKESCVPGP